MRIGIIAASNIRYSPYILLYTSIFNKMNVEYEIIFPDRNGLQESLDAPLHVLPWNSSLSTLANYFLYASAVKKVLKRGKYDFLVVLTGNNAAFLGLWLRRYYKNRYIIDIRDYSHENIRPYFFLEKIAIENSGLNIISSEKFTSFLPKSEYYISHNCADGIRTMIPFSRGKEPIKICYVGGLYYVEQCNKLMKLVKDDPRFAFEVYGTSILEPTLKDMAKELNCDRIIFHGGYMPEEKGKILQKVDILFNAYGNGCALLDYALSNKLYDAYAYVKPILTSPGTYMAEMAGPLSFELDFNKSNLMDSLYSWYMQIDSMKVEEFAAKKLQEVAEENEHTRQKIEEAILSGSQVKE